MNSQFIRCSPALKAFFFASLQFIAGSLAAQFELGGEFRPRYEYRDGYRTLSNPNEKGVSLVTQRTRLNASYLDESGIRSFISFQDLRTWGQFDSNSSESAKSLYEGWVQLPLFDQVAVKIGRQEIEYDDSRMVSSNDWRLQGRSHDAVMLSYQSPDSSLTFHLTGAINNERQVLFQDLYRPTSYKNMVMAWLNKKIEGAEISVLFLDNGYQLADTSINHFRTVGVYVNKRMGDVVVTGSYYAQSGSDGLDRDVSSSMFSMEAKLSVNDQFTINPGFDFLSGTAGENLLDPTYNETNTFIPLFARRHRHFGEQDMFYAGGIDVIPGLRDFWIKTTYTFSDKVTGKLNGHYFLTSEKMLDDTDAIVESQYLGIEFDAALELQYSSDLKLKFGYTHFLPTAAMEVLKRRGDRNEIAHFAYLMLTYKPTFLTRSLK